MPKKKKHERIENVSERQKEIDIENGIRFRERKKEVSLNIDSG